MLEADISGEVKGRGLLSKLLRAVYKTPLEREREFYRRLRELSEKISESPESLSHVVLRGELYLERGEIERARSDFQAALALAGNLDGLTGWQIVEQVMRDRALYGLRVAERKLKSARNV